MSQWNIASYFIASMEKASFYEIIVMVNNKKRCPIKDTMSIKISFMHYRNYITWTRVKWTVAFEEFDMVYLFWLLFSFHHHCQSLSICKRSTLAKICPAPSPRFLRAWTITSNGVLPVFTLFFLKILFQYKNLLQRVDLIWTTQMSIFKHFVSAWV